MDKNNDIENTLDEIFNEYAEHILDDVDLSNTDIDTERWFNESEYSPKKFKNNHIFRATGSKYTSQLIYNSKDVYMKSQGILYICSASLKSSNYMFDEIRPEINSSDNIYSDDSGDNQEFNEVSQEPAKSICIHSNNTNREYKEVSEEPVKSICIYGHTADIDDEFMSRLDSKLLKKLSPYLKNKFRDIYLCGCFDTIEDMQATITGLYDKLSDLSFDSKVKIYLESNVKDDDGRIRNLADLVASGYIKPGIVDRPNIIEFVYKKFEKRMTARLFTKELKVYDGKDLFEQLNENSDGK